MRKSLSITLIATLGLSSLAAAPLLAQSDYPNRKVVSLIVPYPAGGASDVSARIFSGPIGESLGQNVIVENIGGATGAIAANRLLNLPADGYQIFHGSPNELILPTLVNSAVNFKPEDFEFVHAITRATIVVLTSQSIQANTIDEFLQQAKQNQKPLSYATVGAGSLYHLIGEKISLNTDIPLQHVPYRGAAPALTDVASGQVDFAILPFQVSMLGLQNEGRVKILTSLGNQLPEPLKDIPKISESQFLNHMDYSISGGYFVKKGTPTEIKDKLNKAVAYALQQPKVREQLESEGRIVFNPMSPADSEALWEIEIQKHRDLVKEIDFQPL